MGLADGEIVTRRFGDSVGLIIHDKGVGSRDGTMGTLGGDFSSDELFFIVTPLDSEDKFLDNAPLDSEDNAPLDSEDNAPLDSDDDVLDIPSNGSFGTTVHGTVAAALTPTTPSDLNNACLDAGDVLSSCLGPPIFDN